MTTTLLLLPADAAAESIAVRVDAQGQVQSVGQATTPPEPPARTLLVVPGVDVHLRWLRLPGRSMAQSRAAARLQLAEHLAIETQALHVVIAAVDSVAMQQWLARATQLGFAPDAVVPDCLLLEPGVDATVAVTHWDGRWLIRGAQLACSLEPEAARLLLGDRVPAVPPGPDPTQSIACFARYAAHVPIDLLQHPFANKAAAEQQRAPRRLAVLAALVLLSPGLLLLAQTLRYEIGARVLQARAATQLGARDAAAVPAALQARRQAGTATDRLAVQLSTLFGAVDTLPAAELDQLDYNAAQPLRVTLLHNDDASLQQLSARLADAGWHVDPGSSQVEDGRMRTPLTLGPLR
ncbi:type II secretion system protein GspL [Xanthomonas phaseoli pv. dieffenbachiae]|uniref:type II secretion system protein GspL n=1 Tax=Xanthomonas TaxID=338 RepID=UPI0006E6F798|nr:MULTISPECIES: type II secretion system protein GspL [Xanthomonas]MBO9749685.1 type II secretion system protein GspL [Xanthomonas phaseoli pv. dieffenbachiae]MBO9753834.1 type II secretion system protein GspL [Xanthomonas phaseoli pv. dieffenbachiae]MBO9891845.1 type II secretion system protein GspL [Xanthomonas sp. D-36-1]OQP83020.1 type II secretion system protein GspL [Xanthomonas citri]